MGVVSLVLAGRGEGSCDVIDSGLESDQNSSAVFLFLTVVSFRIDWDMGYPFLLYYVLLGWLVGY
jgi:hypothetical protein